MKKYYFMKEQKHKFNLMIRWIVRLLLFLLGMILSSNIQILHASEGERKSVTGITLNVKEEEMNVGDHLSLVVWLQYSDGSKVNANDAQEVLRFKTSDSSVATVNSSGTIKAKAPGEVTIRVFNAEGTISKKCKIIVKRPFLTQTSVTLYEDENYWLYVRNGNGSIKWKSSNTSVVKVSSNGKLTGVSKGTATITVVRSGITMKCKVTVKKVSINASKKSLYVGQTYKLKLIRTQKEVLWTSSNKKIATVSKTGNVTAKQAGKAVITAAIGKITYTCTITVRPSNLLVDKTSITIQSKGKQSIPITYVSTWKHIVIEVSNTSIAKVSLTNMQKQNATITILPQKVGTTTIKIYARSLPKDVKTIKVKVLESAISESPNFTVTMSEDTLKSTKYGIMHIHNKGTKKLMIQSVAYSYDFDYSGYDRRMYLVQAETYKRLDKQMIGTGKSATVKFQMDGKKTWYDRKTKYNFNIKYDGLDYEVVSSYFLGTTITLQ